MKVKSLIALPLIAMSSFFVNCNGNYTGRNNAELCRNRYLSRVAYDAAKNYNNARQVYDEAVTMFEEADSNRAKKVMEDNFAEYKNARYIVQSAKRRLYMAKERGVGVVEYAERSLDKANKEYAPIIETYEKAQREFDISHGEGIKEAEKSLNEGRSRLLKILDYIKLSNKPFEKRTREENEKLDSIYDFCKQTENTGWDSNVSEKLVNYMEHTEK